MASSYRLSIHRACDHGKFFPRSLLILKSNFLSNVVLEPRYAAKGYIETLYGFTFPHLEHKEKIQNLSYKDGNRVQMN